MSAEKDPCSVEGCDRLRQGRQIFCRSHYWYKQRTGRVPTKPLMPPGLPVGDRFKRKFQAADSGCWLWTAKINASGYGVFAVSPFESVLAHRFAYELFVGPIPDGLQLDHLCRVRACCNPEHLEPVTPLENFRRGFAVAAINARKTHCKRGHEFTPANTYVYAGKRGTSRICRACRSSKKAA